MHLKLEFHFKVYLEDRVLYQLSTRLFLIEMVRGLLSAEGRVVAVIGNFTTSIHSVGTNCKSISWLVCYSRYSDPVMPGALKNTSPLVEFTKIPPES